LFLYKGFIIPTVQHSGKNPESKTKLKSDCRKFLNILNRYSESRTDSKAISIEDLYDFFKATNSFDEIDECGENENVIFCMNDGISKELNESITEDDSHQLCYLIHCLQYS
jgi:hypothetical protein